jgi:ectoine hydroxylase-related dioxygenase (phytanoyl-CoA dioxygenase family)
MTLIDLQDRPLPSATTDRAQAFADLDTYGYCIVADALAPAQVAALRRRVIDQGLGEDARGVAFHDSKANQRIWMMVNKGRMFRDLVIHPLVLEMMPHLLGEDFILSSLTANIARPGGETMYLHADQGYIGFWTPRPVVANVLWMLDDFWDENGSTRLIPGSHLRGREPEDTQDRTIAAVGKAGSALVFDGRLIHGTEQTGPRTSIAMASSPTIAAPSYVSRRTSSWAWRLSSGPPSARPSWSGSATASGAGSAAPTRRVKSNC